MQDIFPQTAARLAEWREQPDVLGILLVGSKSREHNDALSDDDLEILLTDEAFVSRTPSECAEYTFEGEEDTRKLIYDAQYTTLTDLQHKLTSPLDLDHWPYERAHILFDRDGNVAPIVEALGHMNATFRHTRLLYSTINTSIALNRASKTLKRGYAGAGHLIVARGARALTRLLFALEWRWVPLDHWLEPELQTLDDPTEAGPLLIEALKTGNPEPLRTALNNLEEWLVAEDIPRPADRSKLFSEQVHPTHDAERAIHGLY